MSFLDCAAQHPADPPLSPMRFPISLTYAATNETLEIQDHKLVFQLADELNQMNAERDPWWQVNFIPWIQSNSA